MTGADTAADNSATVSDHCALSRDTCSVRATEGISGAPRLLMIPATIVTPTIAAQHDRPVGAARPGARLESAGA
jgi:hypothetical protein